MAGDARSGSRVCDSVVSAQPLVRPGCPALLDARHRRNLGNLQRDLWGAHCALSICEARRDLGTGGPRARRPRRPRVHPRRAAAALGSPGVRRRNGNVDGNRAHDRRVRAREFQRRPLVRQRFQLPRRPSGDRPNHPADRHPAGRPGRAGRGVEPQVVAPPLRGKPRCARSCASAEQSAAHDCGGHAAALRLVWQRGLLAPPVADAHRRALDQSDHAADARHLAGGR